MVCRTVENVDRFMYYVKGRQKSQDQVCAARRKISSIRRKCLQTPSTKNGSDDFYQTCVGPLILINTLSHVSQLQ